MRTNSLRLLLSGIVAAAAGSFSPPAVADPAIWANAKWVKATYTECGGLRYLIFKGNEVRVSTASKAPGCKSTEEIYHQLNVARTLFKPGSRGELSGSRVDAAYIFCGKGEAAINLGAAAQVARAIREHPAPPGCTYTAEVYQYVSSIGNIPFTNVENGGTMTVAESLAMHAKERERAIAECNASPACVAEVRRMSALSGPATPSLKCPAQSIYSNLQGNKCVDGSGISDPKGDAVPR